MSQNTFERLVKQLDETTVALEFRKADNTVRKMTATRDLGGIPKDKHPKAATKLEAGKPIPVFDTEKGEWRSFRIDNLISVNGNVPAELANGTNG